MFSENDVAGVLHALALATDAANSQEVPVGAVLVLDETMIGEGSNCPLLENVIQQRMQKLLLCVKARNLLKIIV